MLTQSEFEHVVDSFLDELHAFCAAIDVQNLDAMVPDKAGMAEAANDLRNPSNDLADMLGISYVLVREFIDGARSQVMKEAYYLYTDKSGGKSPRHP